jgi:hypothetical protein
MADITITIHTLAALSVWAYQISCASPLAHQIAGVLLNAGEIGLVVYALKSALHEISPAHVRQLVKERGNCPIRSGKANGKKPISVLIRCEQSILNSGTLDAAEFEDDCRQVLQVLKRFDVEWQGVETDEMDRRLITACGEARSNVCKAPDQMTPAAFYTTLNA